MESCVLNFLKGNNTSSPFQLVHGHEAIVISFGTLVPYQKLILSWSVCCTCKGKHGGGDEEGKRYFLRIVFAKLGFKLANLERDKVCLNHNTSLRKVCFMCMYMYYCIYMINVLNHDSKLVCHNST